MRALHWTSSSPLSLPPGVKGLVIAALPAVLMSSLAAVFNSSSTLVVVDFYKKWRPAAPEKELVRAGQVATVILVAVGLVWLSFIGVTSSRTNVILSIMLGVIVLALWAYFSPWFFDG